jgi:hypothetical protein
MQDFYHDNLKETYQLINLVIQVTGYCYGVLSYKRLMQLGPFPDLLCSQSEL